MFGPSTRGNQKKPARQNRKSTREETVFVENRKRPLREVKEKRARRSTAFVPKLPVAKQLARAMVRLVFATIITGGVLLVGVLAYRHATESSYFAFRKMNLVGNRRLSDADVAEIAGLLEGKNIFKIDLQKAREALLAHAWIIDAEISRRLPESINVQIVEREAVALVNLDVLYLVDDMGNVFKRWVRGDPIPTPIITGISREHYIENAKEVETILCDAIDLAKRYKEAGLAKTASLDEIHREPDDGFSLTIGEDPVYVKFGRGPYRVKFERLAVLIGRLAREGKRPAMIYFDNDVRPDRITVKLKTDGNAMKRNAQSGLLTDEKKMMSKI